MTPFVRPIIAIDPGKSGGIAIRHSDGSILLQAMPPTEGDIVEAIGNCEAGSACYLEKVGGFMRQDKGKNVASGHGMFKFGANFGFVQGVLMALRIPIILVTPGKWQKRLGVGTKSDRTTTQWKNVLKAEAQRRYPQLKITLKTCDALLILDYAKEKEGKK